nr:HNH endonuclease family protein [Corynebacterium lactis]
MLPLAFAIAFLAARFLPGALSTAPDRADAVAVGKQLERVRVVQSRPTVTGYKRELFGVWAGPADCNTRRLVLVAWFGGSRCTLADDRSIADPYTGDGVVSHEVDIDHVYPLAAAWDFGAYAWDSARRREFGNDAETNLVPTLSSVNRDKGDATPGEWMPDKTARCTYAARYLTVALKWDLAVTESDWEALAAACGIEKK